MYAAHERIVGGDRESMLDLLHEAWRDDTAAGKRSLMIANDTETVRELNQRAREDRIRSGAGAAEGLTLSDGTTVGVGDVVVTRRNARALASGSGWVKNGDLWQVIAVRRDGSLEVKRPTRGGTATLPASYVRQHVQLGYATTAHRAQGRTVDTAHAFVAATTTREPLYVMATRGRESNRLYIDTAYDPDVDTAHEPVPEIDATQVLRQVLATSGDDSSATETMTKEWDRVQNVARNGTERRVMAGQDLEHNDTRMLESSGLTLHGV